MVTTQQLINKWGNPSNFNEGLFMSLYYIPQDIRDCIPCLPEKIYCNNDFKGPFEQGLQNVIERGLQDEIKTWNGCFVIRKSRGLNSWSTHSWGISFDINKATNELGATPQMSKELVKCFTDAGFDWGGTWRRKDGMHFQLAKI